MGKSLISKIGHDRDDKDIRTYFGDMGPAPLFWTEGKWYGRAWAQSPKNQKISINVTGYPGYITKCYFGLTFALGKDKFKIEKINESIDVSPEHQQYWQITLAQKEALEQKLKQTLMAISSSISDLELVRTDLERYEEFLKWIEDAKSNDPNRARQAQLVLKSFFVDQVDYYAGGGGAEGPGRLSMAFMRNRGIMPTVVQDFMAMEGIQDIEEGGKLSHIPEVEKQVLRSKWKAYEDWLRIFESNVRTRVEHLRTMVRSRERTLEEWRERAKPIILRYKMINDALSSASVRKSMPHVFFRLVGHATAIISIDIWLWKNYPLFEEFPTPGELRAKVIGEIHPYNSWTKEHLVFHPDVGLIADYPWMTEEWVETKASGILSKMNWKGRYYHFYIFMPVTLEKVNLRLANGSEIEDGTFNITNWVLSSNVMFCKLLELEAIKEENEIYVDEFLGIKHRIPGRPVVFYRKEKGEQKILQGHYNAIRNFVFENGGTSIELPPLQTYTVKELKEKLGNDRMKYINLKEYVTLSSRMDSIREFFQFFGIDIVPYRFKGPYGHFSKDFANKYVAKPASQHFLGVVGTLLKVSKFGKILKPAG